MEVPNAGDETQSKSYTSLKKLVDSKQILRAHPEIVISMLQQKRTLGSLVLAVINIE